MAAGDCIHRLFCLRIHEAHVQVHIPVKLVFICGIREVFNAGPMGDCGPHLGLLSKAEFNLMKRDADGVSPLKPYIEDIESISSMDEMYDYLANPIRNPLFLSPVSTSIPYVIHSGIHKDSYAVFFSAPDLSLTVNGNNDAYFSLENENAFEK